MRDAATQLSPARRLAHPLRNVTLAVSLVLVASLGAALVDAEPAGAAQTLFVSATGSDVNPCTSAAPCATITHALSLVSVASPTIEVAGTIDDANIAVTSVTIEQWPGQAPAVVDAEGAGPVFAVYGGVNVTIEGLTITGGSAGGIDLNGPVIGGAPVSATVLNSTITGNTTTGSPDAAGGIYNLEGTLTVSNSTISDNQVTSGAGTYRAGGISSVGGTTTITESTITGNSVDVGTGAGAIDAISGTTTITDSTIAANVSPCCSGPGTTGGIYSSYSTTTVGATIVAGNHAGGTWNNCADGLISVGYNLFEDPFGTGCLEVIELNPTDKVNVSPDLGPLAANGGPTETELPAPDSTAIGAIPSPTTLNGVSVCGPGAFDQRGVPRPISGSWCTIGAVDEAPQPPSPSLAGGVRLAVLPSGTGYWIVHPDGGVFSYGTAPFYGSVPGLGLRLDDIVGIAATPDGRGYWLVGRDGGVFSFGDAGFWGSTGAMKLNQPIVSIEAMPDGGGYWLVASDGGVFAFGSAGFYGSMGAHPLNKPIVGMAASPNGGGYWLVASDGGVFTFGDASFWGSTGSLNLNAPIVGLTPTPKGAGYWLVAQDGGVFTFGNAPFAGSVAGSQLFSIVIGLFSTNGGTAYTLVESNGTPAQF
jgi:hypothetical protein